MIFDKRKLKEPLQPLAIDNQEIEQVTSYKYLGTVVDCDLSWTLNSEAIFKKCRQRMHLLRVLSDFNVGFDIRKTFSDACIVPLLLSNFLAWFGNCLEKDKTLLDRIPKQISKLTDSQPFIIQDHFEKLVLTKINKILQDSTHPLFHRYKLLPSGRRLQAIKCNLERTRKSFIPTSIRVANDNSKWMYCLSSWCVYYFFDSSLVLLCNIFV